MNILTLAPAFSPYADHVTPFCEFAEPFCTMDIAKESTGGGFEFVIPITVPSVIRPIVPVGPLLKPVCPSCCRPFGIKFFEQFFNHNSRNANALHLESVPNVVYSHPGSQVHPKDLLSHLEWNLRRSLYSFF